jgi:hypothetical protein
VRLACGKDFSSTKPTTTTTKTTRFKIEPNLNFQSQTFNPIPNPNPNTNHWPLHILIAQNVSLFVSPKYYTRRD